MMLNNGCIVSDKKKTVKVPKIKDSKLIDNLGESSAFVSGALKAISEKQTLEKIGVYANVARMLNNNGFGRLNKSFNNSDFKKAIKIKKHFNGIQKVK